MTKDLIDWDTIDGRVLVPPNERLSPKPYDDMMGVSKTHEGDKMEV